MTSYRCEVVKYTRPRWWQTKRAWVRYYLTVDGIEYEVSRKDFTAVESMRKGRQQA